MTPAETVLLVCAVLYCVGLISTIVISVRAPRGIEDDEGFHEC